MYRYAERNDQQMQTRRMINLSNKEKLKDAGIRIRIRIRMHGMRGRENHQARFKITPHP